MSKYFKTIPAKVATTQDPKGAVVELGDNLDKSQSIAEDAGNIHGAQFLIRLIDERGEDLNVLTFAALIRHAASLEEAKVALDRLAPDKKIDRNAKGGLTDFLSGKKINQPLIESWLSEWFHPSKSLARWDRLVERAGNRRRAGSR